MLAIFGDKKGVPVQKAIKYVLIGIGSLVAPAAAIILLAIFLPESPSEIEHLGVFDVYHFHHSSIGEPGHSRRELWYHGKQLAEYPEEATLNPEQDRIIFVNARDAPPGAPTPKGNGIYYFDSRSQKKYLLTSRKFPEFFNSKISLGVASLPRNSDATPWSPHESFAVVSYGDNTNLPKAVLKSGQIGFPFEKENVLLVDLGTGEVRNAADLLNVSESEHIIFRGWSDDNSAMFFSVGGEARMLPVSAVLKK
jgi:hypothetical protein